MRKVGKIDKTVVLMVCSILIVLITVLFLIKIFSTSKEVNAFSKEDFEIVVNNNPINIKQILKDNTSSQITEEMVLEEIDLEYTTEYKNNSSLPKGTIQVLQEGRDGRQNAVIIKKYENGELISEELVAENLIKASVNKIVEIGTGAGTNNYKAKVGDTVYVTSNLLAVRLEPDANSEKLCTLKKDDEVKIQKIEKDWFYITSREQNGYIASDCITNINPKAVVTNDISDGNEYSKQTLLAKLNFDMNLATPSNLSLNQFKKILEGQANDKNGIFRDNAEYFYYAEKQYKINGVFLAGVAIHESGWGTSKIALDKKNLFGYGAMDSNPYRRSIQLQYLC